MRKILIITYFLIIVFTLNSKAQDFWERLPFFDTINAYNIEFNTIGNIYISTPNGIYKSEDEGMNWVNIGPNTAVGAFVITSQKYIYAGLTSGSKIFYTYNDGQTWDTIQTNIFSGNIYLSLDNILFLLDWGVIYKSTDWGYTWIQVLSTVNSEVFNDIIEKDSFLFAGSMHFMSSTGGGVYRSSDNGDIWEHVSMAGHGVSSFALDIDGNLLAGTQLNHFGVYRSENNGIIWQKILSGHVVTSLAVDEFGGIYAGYDSDFGPSGVKYSDDNGLSWSSLNSGFHPNASITSLSISPENYIYATTINPNYLYRSVSPIVSISEKSREQLDIKVFPNPFTNSSSIKYDLKVSGNVKIYIYSSQGQKIKKILLGNKQTGKHEQIIQTKNWPTGLYFCSLIINEKIVDTKKMVCIK